MTEHTVPVYAPRLQAAVNAALAKFPADSVRIHRGAAIVANGDVREPANGTGWLIGVHGWEVDGACPCPDHIMNGVLRCKHWYAKALYRKMQTLAEPDPIESLAFYGDFAGVPGVITVYNSGTISATFQPHSGMFPVPILLERWDEVVLGGRKDLIDAVYPVA